jgi:hypothetical protein
MTPKYLVIAGSIMATPRTQQTEPTRAQAQTTPPNKNNMRVDYSPLKRTPNFERFIQ